MSSSSLLPPPPPETTPLVVRDPRFRAARTLVESGVSWEQAIEIFATLLQEAKRRFGDDHIETAPAYYEYGNALFRSCNHKQEEEEKQEGGGEEGQEGEGEEPTTVASDNVKAKASTAAAAAAAAKSDGKVVASKEKDRQRQLREAAAAAAERRAAAAGSQASSADLKPPPKESPSQQEDSEQEPNGEKELVQSNGAATTTTTDSTKDNAQEAAAADKDNEDDDDEDDDDVQLALEMMETAWSILDSYTQQQQEDEEEETCSTSSYREWAKDQIARVLTGIGDVLSALERYADAADAYCRALGHRQEALEQHRQEHQHQQAASNKDDNNDLSLEYLQKRRRVVEANILLAEALLACPADEDVITTESRHCLVRAAERVEYARGYYDKARDELQETVLLMGHMVAAQKEDDAALAREKENVCFVATMIMGIGTTLAELDEQQQEQQSAVSDDKEVKEPSKKKAKTGK